LQALKVKTDMLIVPTCICSAAVVAERAVVKGANEGGVEWMSETARAELERPGSESESEMAELVLPNDTNMLGNMLGGRIMHLIDLVAAMAALRHSRMHVVTASMDHIDFIAPVRVGDLLILKSSVNRAYRTSMEVGVKVWAENTIEGTHRHVASAYLTFVAVTREGRSTAVPALRPVGEEAARRYEDAARRREQRQSELARKREKHQLDSPKLPGAVRSR
jgi:acyl-CoA hydrolase